MNNIVKTLLFGVLLFAIHWTVNQFLLSGAWQTPHVYWIVPAIMVLSVLIIITTQKVGEKSPDKIGMTYAMLGMARLIILAVLILVLANYLSDEEKTPFIAHFMAPALLFMGLEAALVKKELNKAE